MVLIKHNYLKSDIFFNPIFIPGFSGSSFLGSGSRVQGPGPSYRSSRNVSFERKKSFVNRVIESHSRPVRQNEEKYN